MIAQTAVDLIDMGNLALRQGNVALARWQYEESLILWRALDDAPGMAHALARLRTLEGNSVSTKWAGARERSSDAGTPAGSEAPLRGRLGLGSGRVGLSVVVAPHEEPEPRSASRGAV